MRLASLFLYVIIGAVIGLLVGRLALIPIAIVLPVNRAWMTKGTSSSRTPMRLFDTTSTSTSDHPTRRDLMTPDEIMRLDSSLEILLRQGAAPAIAAKVRYYDGPEFRGNVLNQPQVKGRDSLRHGL